MDDHHAVSLVVLFSTRAVPYHDLGWSNAQPGRNRTYGGVIQFLTPGQRRVCLFRERRTNTIKSILSVGPTIVPPKQSPLRWGLLLQSINPPSGTSHLQKNALLPAKGHQFSPLKERVKLDLVDGRGDLRG